MKINPIRKFSTTKLNPINPPKKDDTDILINSKLQKTDSGDSKSTETSVSSPKENNRSYNTIKRPQLDPLLNRPTHTLNLTNNDAKVLSNEMKNKFKHASLLNNKNVQQYQQEIKTEVKNIKEAVTELANKKVKANNHPLYKEFESKLNEYKNLHFISLGEGKNGFWMTSDKPLDEAEIKQIKDESLKAGKLIISEANKALTHQEEDNQQSKISIKIKEIAIGLSESGWEKQTLLMSRGIEFEKKLGDLSFTKVQAPPTKKDVNRLIEKIKDCDKNGITASSVTAVNDTVRFQLMTPFKKTGAVLKEFSKSFLGNDVKLINIKDRYAKPSGSGWSDVSMTLEIDGVLAEVLVTSPLTGVVKNLWPAHGAYEVIRNPDNKEIKDSSTTTMRVALQSMLLLAVLNETAILDNIKSPQEFEINFSPFTELTKDIKKEFIAIESKNEEVRAIVKETATQQQVRALLGDKIADQINNPTLHQHREKSMAVVNANQKVLINLLTGTSAIGLLNPKNEKGNLMEMNKSAETTCVNKLNELGLDTSLLLDKFKSEITDYFGMV